ncbi:hydroxyacid dehydrogenase [Streptomyces coelicoflavus]|uniref:Hydroxyacid dehydrogenase n=1 Tax=Streptomyces coelicoflavus TaxID=285562 RepID=A0A7K3PQQ4_9ACTN|nr:hydroxyacid dehydrogenase [Streptomyces coelicoflavus]
MERTARRQGSLRGLLPRSCPARSHHRYRGPGLRPLHRSCRGGGSVSAVREAPLLVSVRGAADIVLLQRHLPGCAIREITALAPADPELASRAEVLVLRSGHQLDAERLAEWPRLRHVIRAGSGLDGIDVPGLAARGVTVHRNPEPAADAVAEWALAALLALARRIPYGHAALLRGQHAKQHCLAPPLSRTRAAIWGAGPVGRACAKALAPHVAEIAFAARRGLPDTTPSRPASELPAWADAHVVALPLTEENRGAFGTAFLGAARERHPLLLCVGRLGTLDLPACLRALADGGLGGLALDPVEEADLPLWPAEDISGPLNLIATPHIGAQRHDVRALLDRWVATTAAGVLAGAARSAS